MQSQFQAAINQLVVEKNLPKDLVLQIIEDAFKAAYKKDYGHRDQNVEVELTDGGDNAHVFLILEVVEEVENEHTQITLEQAKGYNKKAVIGDIIRQDVTPMDYGRIAAQSAKQVIIQKIQEAERNIMYDNFKDRENELLNAQVHRVQNEHVFVDLGKIIVELPKEYQIPGEKYYAGQRIKLYLDKVVKTTKGPKLLISRTHKYLVAKLLEIEIPEIAEGTVKLEAIARDAGLRTKIAVSAEDEKIDPIGSCVGQKGVRIQSIMDELNGERIDVIRYTEDKISLLKSAMSPAEIIYIDLDEENGRAKVYVNEDQRSLAIGKKGQNVRLASKLLEIEVDILDSSEIPEGAELLSSVKSQNEKVENEDVSTKASDELTISDLQLPEYAVEALTEANLTLAIQLKGLSISDLQTIDGIDEDAALDIHEAVSKI